MKHVHTKMESYLLLNQTVHVVTIEFLRAKRVGREVRS
jgi:hypothetical protein